MLENEKPSQTSKQTDLKNEKQITYLEKKKKSCKGEKEKESLLGTPSLPWASRLTPLPQPYHLRYLACLLIYHTSYLAPSK